MAGPERPLRARTLPSRAPSGEYDALRAEDDAWARGSARVTVLDVDGATLRWSAMSGAEERALGVSFAPMRGRALRERSELAFEEWLSQHARGALAADGPVEVEPEHPEPGTGRWLARTLTPVRDARGAVRRVVVESRDVSEARQLAALLAQATRMDAVGRAAGAAAREFNNLLVAISGYAGMALKSLPTEARARDHIAEMLRIAEAASSLTRRVLAVAHRQQGAPALVRLDDVVGAMERVLPRMLREGITVRSVRAPDLWRVKVDPHQIEQVLLHLAAWARETMPRGGELHLAAANVTLTQEEAYLHGVSAGEHVSLTVRDTGEGMDAATLQRVFDAQRAAAATDVELGLAASYAILRAHGGALSVASAPGQGTTFRALLPRSVEKTTASGVALATSALRGHETVLVCDPTAARDASARVLRMLGYTVLEAPSLDAAARVVEGHGRAPLDLVVLGDARDDATRLLRAVAALHGEARVLACGEAGPWRDAREFAAVRVVSAASDLPPTALARRVREALDARP